MTDIQLAKMLFDCRRAAAVGLDPEAFEEARLAAISDLIDAYRAAR